MTEAATERVTPEEERAVRRHLESLPVTHTRRGHAKLHVYLALAIEASNELADEVYGHRCEDDPDDPVCDDCVLANHATGMTYTLQQFYASAWSSCRDNHRLDVFADRLNDLLGEWIDRDRLAGKPGKPGKPAPDDTPTPDAIRTR